VHFALEGASAVNLSHHSIMDMKPLLQFS